MPEIEENIPDSELYKGYILPDPVLYTFEAVRERSNDAYEFLMSHFVLLGIHTNVSIWGKVRVTNHTKQLS